MLSWRWEKSLLICQQLIDDTSDFSECEWKIFEKKKLSTELSNKIKGLGFLTRQKKKSSESFREIFFLLDQITKALSR